MKWLLLLVAVIALAFWLGARWSAGRGGESVAFTPVAELPTEVRSRVERDLAAGLTARAARTYRDATGASPAAARAALAVHGRGASA